MRQAINFPIHPKAVEYFRPGGVDAVLLCHGFAGSPYDLRELADLLAEAGATVCVVRLAGHGTDPRDLAATTIDDWRSSIDSALSRLGRIRSLLLVGNSFGGNLLIDLSIRRKLPVSGFVLLSTPAFTHGEAWKRLLLPLVLPWKFSVKKSWVKNEGRSHYLNKGSYVEIPLRAYRQFLLFLRAVSRAQFRLISAPVLLLYSLHDTVIKPKSAEFIYQQVATEDRQIVWVDDTYHSPLTSKKKRQLYITILDFYRKQRDAWMKEGPMVRYEGSQPKGESVYSRE
jgi:carboxylesterase